MDGIEDMKKMYAEALGFANDMLDSYDALTVATMMCNVSLSLYKTILPADEFDSFVRMVAETKDMIKPFGPPTGSLQ